MARPDLSHVPSFYHNYINLVQDEDLLTALKDGGQQVLSFLRAIQDEKWDYSYAAGKWTIKELVQHITDTERIFNYRALCFARQEKAALPGFDENSYAAASKAGRRSKEALMEELDIVQQSSLFLFSSFDEEQMAASGIANGKPVSVLAIGFIITGHALHHRNIIKERYL